MSGALSDAQQAYLQQVRRLFVWPEGQRFSEQNRSNPDKWFSHGDEPLNESDLEAHLLGQRTIGLRANGHAGLCRYGAIDVDVEAHVATWRDALELVGRLQAAAAAYGINTLAEFSGNKGLHLLVPSAEPLPWGVMQQTLKRLLTDAGFETLNRAIELFPAERRLDQEDQPLKLVGALHHKNGRRALLLPPITDTGACKALEAALRAYLVDGTSEPPEALSWAFQAALMASFEPSPPTAFEKAASKALVAAAEVSRARTDTPDLSRLPDGQHPACIATRMETGPLCVENLHRENLVLATYCAQRGVGQEEAESMAVRLYELTPPGFSKKTAQEALDDFRQSLRDAQENPEDLAFGCRRAVYGGPLEAKALVARGLCAGEACPAWPWGELEPSKLTFKWGDKGTSNAAPQKGELHGRRLWQAIQHVIAQGQPVTLSLVLAAAESVEVLEGYPRQSSMADVMAEAEFLRGCLTGDGAQRLAGVVLHPSAFGCPSEEPWDDWVSALQRRPETSMDVWQAHLTRLADTATRAQALLLSEQIAQTAFDQKRQPADTLTDASQGVSALLRSVTPDLQPVTDQMEAVLSDLVDRTRPKVPIFHPGLRRVLGGGLRAGQLIAAGGPPGCGKTTMALQMADYAAQAGVPVIFISMEMTRTQLVQASLSRLSGLESDELARALSKASGGDTDARATAVRDAEAALTDYLQAIAPNLYLVEGGECHTPGRIQALIGQVRHQKGLPDDAPVLVVVDYLQLLYLGADGEASMPEPIRVGSLATALKRVARSTGAAVLALSDVTKQAMEEAERGGRIGPGVFKESGRILHAVDVALAVQSGTVPARAAKPGSKEGAQPARNLLEVALMEPGLSAERRRALESADRELVHSGDTFARWTVLKNRGGAAGGEVWSLYRRHLSSYEPAMPADIRELREDHGR